MKTLQTKEELTNQQLGPVLAIMRELQPYLLDDAVEPGDTPTSSAVDGGVSSAAETTFLKACDRVNSILDDETRWDIKAHTDVIGEFAKTQRLQQKFIAIQTESAARLNTPHVLLRPTVAVMGESYVAFWGNIAEPGQAICGVGNTPRAALADFDKAFDRAPKDQVVIIAEKAGLDLNQPPTTPPNEKE